MNQRMQEIWRKLEAFNVDDPGDGSPLPAFTFAMRLADENGWPLGYAERVIREYKRFVFLATFAGHPVTPSDQVDQAWHLHLSYTRSYWNRLCEQVLERRLHHDPTRGGQAESEKFDTWYARTLESYQRLFADTPPADIWPAPLERFDTTRRWKRVDVSRFWLLRRRTWIRRGVGTPLAIGTLAVAGGWSMPMLAMTSRQWGIVAIAVAVIVLLVALIVAARRFARTGGSSVTGSHGCAFVNGGCGSGGTHHAGADSADSSDGGGSGCGGGGCGGGGGD